MDVVTTDTYYVKDNYPFWWCFFVWYGVSSMLESISPIPSEAEKTEINAWMILTLRRIPCIFCRMHALELYQTHPIDLSSQQAARQWWSDFHNLVNKQLGKPELSREQVSSSDQFVRSVYWPKVWKDLQDGTFMANSPTGDNVTTVTTNSKTIQFLIVLFFVLLTCALLGMLYYRSAFYSLKGHLAKSEL